MTQVFLSWAKEDQSLMEPDPQCADAGRESRVWTGQELTSKLVLISKWRFATALSEPTRLIYLISPDSIESALLPRRNQLRPQLEQTDRAPTDPTQLTRSKCRPRAAIVGVHQLHRQQSARRLPARPIDVLIRSLYLKKRPTTSSTNVLLVKALKWRRQQQNPTLLLRGYTLSQSGRLVSGGQVARVDIRPILLQEQLIWRPACGSPSGVADGCVHLLTRGETADLAAAAG